MQTTEHSFFAVESSSFPPMHVSFQHVYSEVEHVRLVLEDIVDRMPDILRGSDLFALWVVQRGQVTRVLDLRPFFHGLGDGTESEEPVNVEWSWDEIARELPELAPPGLTAGETAIACWQDESLGYPGVQDAWVFQLGRPRELQCGSVEAGETGEDITPPALQELLAQGENA